MLPDFNDKDDVIDKGGKILAFILLLVITLAISAILALSVVWMAKQVFDG